MENPHRLAFLLAGIGEIKNERRLTIDILDGLYCLIYKFMTGESPKRKANEEYKIMKVPGSEDDYVRIRKGR